MNTPHDDRLQQDLDRLESRYRKLAPDTPPEMLDQAILNRARRAVEPASKRPWSFGWMHATATAALLVIGLTLVLQQRGELVPESPLREEWRSMDGVSNEMQRRQPVPEAEEQAAPAAAIGEVFAPLAAEPEPVLQDEAETLSSKQVIARDRDDLEADSAVQAAMPPPPEPARKAEVSGLRARSADQVTPPDVLNAPAGEDRRAKNDLARETEAAAEQARQDAAQSAERESTQKRMFPGDAVTPEPEAWLAAIEARRLEGGESSGWLEELKRFVEMYPEHPLPESLQQALAEVAPDKP